MASRSAFCAMAMCLLASVHAFTAPAAFLGRVASRQSVSSVGLRPSRLARAPLQLAMSDHETQLKECKVALDDLIDKTNANPIMVRLAWHDSGTHTASMAGEEWPKSGGAIGSIRFEPEILHGANAGESNQPVSIGLVPHPAATAMTPTLRQEDSSVPSPPPLHTMRARIPNPWIASIL